MTTMILEIPNSTDIRNIAVAVRQLKGVAKIRVQKETKVESIPGLAYTYEERIAKVRNAMDGYRRGEKGLTQDEMKKKVIPVNLCKGINK